MIVPSTTTLLWRMLPHERPMVFTNGVFDILHVGHLRYLQAARALGGSLVVAVNSDQSAAMQPKVLNGETSAPMNSCFDRMEMLDALRFVDYVIPFDDVSPLTMLARLMPDIYCKGGDYDVPNTPEGQLVKHNGGRAVTLPYVAGYSSRRYRDRIDG